MIGWLHVPGSEVRPNIMKEEIGRAELLVL
jgi:hypothetical protein